MTRPIDPAVAAAEAGRFVKQRIPRKQRIHRRQHRGGDDDDDDDGGDDAMSVKAFCRRHHISESMFFKLRAQGKAPTTMLVGRRVLISREAAAAWRRAREQAAISDTAA